VADALSASPETRQVYVYRCNDRSWLTGVISSQIAPRLETWLPAAWSANTVTWIGSAMMWLLLIGVGCVPILPRGQWAPLWISLLWGYCLLDHVDGCRARRRRSSSPWGEFLDHALDAWHGTIAVWALGLMGGDAVHPGLIVVMIACVALATAATWLEQKVRGEFFLGAIGPVEAVVATGIYFALWMFPATTGILRSPLSARSGFTWAEFLLAFACAGNLLTAFRVVARTRRIAAPLAAVAALVAALAALGFSSRLGWPVLGAAIALLTADFSARVLVSHLTRAAVPWPDLTGFALLLVAAANPERLQPVAGASLLWLAVRAVRTWRSAAQKLMVRAAIFRAPGPLVVEAK
jgi:phosphatidylglycerophosphate synthase